MKAKNDFDFIWYNRDLSSISTRSKQIYDEFRS
jgi:hypothetical protein